MPAFPAIAQSPTVMQQLIHYLTISKKDIGQGQSRNTLTSVKHGREDVDHMEENVGRYEFTGYRQFLDQDHYPAIKPPWGTLNAINLNTGKYLWKIPFGEYPKLAAEGVRDTGSENYGGPILTAGGVLFIGATVFDDEFHAYNSNTGKLLWKYKLPSAGVSTPITYMVDGKQYVVIAAGGSKLLPPSEGVYVAFSLPSPREGGSTVIK